MTLVQPVESAESHVNHIALDREALSVLKKCNLCPTIGTLGEIDVAVKIPIAVAENATVKMTCEYNLNDMPLYSVKWYKSKDEFYRFIPKELPSKSVFPPLAAKVDVSKPTTFSFYSDIAARCPIQSSNLYIEFPSLVASIQEHIIRTSRDLIIVSPFSRTTRYNGRL